MGGILGERGVSLIVYSNIIVDEFSELQIKFRIVEEMTPPVFSSDFNTELIFILF